MQEPIISFRDVTVRYPGVVANDAVSLDIRPGEIFALVGENGAGKTTLMNVLYGLAEPCEGTVTVKRRIFHRLIPKEAIALGVGMVHQHFKFVPSFTVTQNLWLGNEPRRGPFVDRVTMRASVAQASKTFGLVVDPDAEVGSLSVGMQQRVEMLKTLHRGAEVLILDEPTAVLTPQETDELFHVLRTIVQERGITVILITHKLYEVMALSDRVGVMRQGKLIGIVDTAQTSETQLASMMVGREVLMESLPHPETVGDVAIAVRDLMVVSDRGLPAVRGFSLSIARGEIVGIAAVEGNGQSELVEAIAGLRPLRGGSIAVLGRNTRKLSPGEVRALGLAHIPEDRLSTGVSSAASVQENLLAGKQRAKAFAWRGMVSRARPMAAYATSLMQRFDVRGGTLSTPAGSLSGGNLQKVVLAREISFDAPVLLVSQPTRGVDIGAMEFIHHALMEKRDQGAAILLVSADLDEVMRLSDRVITLYEGKQTGEFDPKTTSKAAIGLAMLGVHDE